MARLFDLEFAQVNTTKLASLDLCIQRNTCLCAATKPAHILRHRFRYCNASAVVEVIHTSQIHIHMKPLISGSTREWFKDSPEVVSTRSRNAPANRCTSIVGTLKCVCAEWRFLKSRHQERVTELKCRQASFSLLSLLLTITSHNTNTLLLPSSLPPPPRHQQPRPRPHSICAWTVTLHVETAGSFTVNRNVSQLQPVTARLIWFPCSSLS